MAENKKNWDELEFTEIVEKNNVLSWKPSQPGDFIRGEYLKTENGKGRGQGLLFHHLKDEDDIEVSILGSTMLNSKMEQVEQGDIIQITYKGKSTTQNGREYNNFAVSVGHPPIENE